MPAKTGAAARVADQLSLSKADKAELAADASAKADHTKPMGNTARLAAYLNGNNSAAKITASWKIREGKPVKTNTYPVTAKQHKRLMANATDAERKLNTPAKKKVTKE